MDPTTINNNFVVNDSNPNMIPLAPLRPYQHGDTIRVLTMNTAFLPAMAAKITSGKTKLAKETERLTEFIETFNAEQFDVICLQEMFNVKLLKKLFTCLNASEAKTQRVYSITNAQGQSDKYYFYAPAGLGRKTPSLKSGSGCVILSKFPIVKATAVPFKVLVGSDWFTHKGFVHVEIDVLGRRLHFANTHSQANPDTFPLWWLWSLKGGSTVQAISARATHQQQMRLFLMKMKEEMGYTPNFFLVGDMNVKYGGSEYANMMEILGQPIDVVQALHPSEDNWTGRQKRLDYIFSYAHYHDLDVPAAVDHVEIMSCDVSDFKTRNTLSDHKGIHMSLRFTEP